MKVRIIMLLEVFLFAALFCIFAYFVIYRQMAGGYRLAAYFYNLIFITIVIFLDKFLNYIVSRDNAFVKGTSPFNRFATNVIFYFHAASFKTGMYLFYIVMLILSRVSVLAPYVVDRYDFSFIYSVEYGILLLIPIDKFFENLAKDRRRANYIMAKKRRNKSKDE